MLDAMPETSAGVSLLPVSMPSVSTTSARLRVARVSIVFDALAIASWWVTAICGLLILARWLPAKGRHVPEAAGDGWSDGPGLSLLAHLGMVVGVLVFTYAYLTAAV